jgi:hypothetical protein
MKTPSVAPDASAGCAAQACDKRALLAALKKIEPVLKSFPNCEGKITSAGLKARIAKAPDTLGDCVAGLTPPVGHGNGAWDFAMSLLLRRVLAAPSRTIVDGNLVIKGKNRVTVYYGDLEVSGDLTFDGLLIVLGNLAVGGVLRHGATQPNLWVAGSLSAKAIHCEFTGWVGGGLKADAVVLGICGSFFTVDGIDTPVAIRDDFTGQGFRGPVRAKVLVDVETDETGLGDNISEDYLEPDEVDEWSLDVDALIAAVAQGKSVLR